MNRDDLKQKFREERNAALQPLPSDFYTNAAAYVRNLEDEIKDVNNPRSVEAKMLEDELQSAIADIENIFIRRIRKITTRATSHAFSNTTTEHDLDKLLKEEQDVYNSTLKAINKARTKLLEPILDPKISESQLINSTEIIKEQESSHAHSSAKEADLSSEEDIAKKEHIIDKDNTSEKKIETEISKSNINKEYDVVRILKDIPEFLAMDNRTYQLKTEDIVSLPSLNAKALIKRGAAISIPK